MQLPPVDPVDEDRARLESAAGAEYEVLRLIGQGGMGRVFLARDRRLGRHAAIKVLPPLDAMRAARVERFRREAETAAQLSHPNIVAVYGAGGDAATPWFAMAFIEGETLADRIARSGPLGEAEALRLARSVSDALAYAHRRGVIHRDVKPSNILIDTESGRPLVADFGISRALGSDSMTATGAALGTPGYMAPEQAGGGEVDARADQFALGLVCYEMLTGRRFDADFGVWPADTSAVRRALRSVARPPVAAAIARATALRREERFATLEEFAAALVSAGRSTVFPRAAAAVGVVLLVGAIGLVVRLSRPGGVPASAAVPGATGIALLDWGGDSAASDSLLPLLRYQLAGFTAVRLADPRVFDPGRSADARSDNVLAAARRAGAGWILHGFIAGDAAGRELSVRAVEVASGRLLELGTVRAAGIGLAAADSVVLLVARSEAARALGLADAPSQAPRSLAAARAFADAEEAFRRADYEVAARTYAAVTVLDSGFALARYKRFLAELQSEPTEARVRAAVAAMRNVRAVGPREQELLAAYVQLFDSADITGAERRLARLVAAEPAFLDGWFALGEVRFHFGALAGLPPDSAEAAWRRALELWPGAAPAEMHLVPIDLWFGRRDAARERMTRYLATDSASAVGRAMALGRDLLFGSLGTRGDLLRRLGTLDERVLELGAITGVAAAADRADLALSRVAFEELARPGRSQRVRSEAANFAIATLLAEGRWRDAQAELARYRAELPGDRELPLWPAAAAALGFPGAVAAAPIDAAIIIDVPRVPFSGFASGWLQRWGAARRAIAAGDTIAAMEHLTAQDLLASPADAVVRGPAWLLHGRILAARGDRAGAERYLRRAHNLLRYAEPPYDAIRDSAAAALSALGTSP